MSKEYIEKVFEKFNEHLNIENNDRIIFSGKFGIGKSFFLDEFFKEEKYVKQYLPIFLNPVNYSVSSNEDIFELIKFDILYQILNTEIIGFEKFEFSKGNLFYRYVANKLQDTFVTNIDAIGENLIDASPFKPYKFLKNFAVLLSKLEQSGLRDYKKFEDEIQKNPELEIIEKFFNNNKEKIGSQYEHNAITQIVYELIEKIEQEKEIKTILIIDDLDRIDPEHIFRILNILSAHNNLGDNKFGFEKIILVCDLKNIKHIYHHFYGQEVDFFGYINKFYSTDVYDYNNKDYVKWFDLNFVSDNYGAGNIEFLRFILSDAIYKNFITARQLFNNDFSKKGVLELFNYYSQKNYRIYHNNYEVRNFHIFQQTYA